MIPMKMPAIFAASLLLSACSQIPQVPSGQVVQTRVSADGTVQSQVLSPYYEARADLPDGRLHAHLIATLGKERLPEGRGLSISLRDRMVNAAIEEVEVYFTNRSSEPLVVEDVRL
jgi:hypothetical protein